MTAWGVIMVVLALSYMWKPFDGADDFMPGWLNLLVLVALAGWALAQWHVVRTLMAGSKAGSARARDTVSFD